ncbi:MAG: sigma-70 family RNA polymerase sigma factor [Bacteroidota bacterium]|nr:sigma-70 family RNA polymerase sigma factor [Bacteroidota bacterium]MDX5431340.1 sigma-70 family RNA polymerase sigma factor [Bacteroidota bacterium]
MENVTVEDLLLRISDRVSDLNGANQAFEILFRKYAEDLTKAMRGVLKSKGVYNPDLVESTVNNVFVEVYSNPLNFSYDSSKHKSEETAFKAWIYRIARNELADLMKASIQHSSLYVLGIEDEVIETMAEIEVGPEVISGNRELLDKALSILSERDRAILLTYFDCHAEGKYAPSEVLDTMCEYWDTTRENARQIKFRSLKRVKEQIEKLAQQKPVK